MKKLLNLFVVFFVSLTVLGITSGDAEARRFGGGGSFGMKRQMTAPKPAPTRQATPASPNSASGAQAAPKRSWLGPVAGLAAGLGLASLMSHLGLSEEFGSILMIALLAWGVLSVIKILGRRQVPTSPSHLQYAGLGRTEIAPQEHVGSGTAERGASIPANFDSESFLRVAKLNFVRLQTANDDGNLDDIREFVSPEVFAEIKMQMDERGAAAQRTDVVTLNAELLEVVTEGSRHIASVHFSGMIRESEGETASPFSEVWHLAKPEDDSRGWSVAGIQQVN